MTRQAPSMDWLVSVLRETDPGPSTNPRPLAQAFTWHDIPLDVRELCRRAADARHRQKRTYESSRYWHGDSHYVGLLGEWVFAQETSLPVNWELIATGDGGVDFGSVDVKASTFVSDPHLKHPASAKRWPTYLALVVVEEARGRYLGYATAEELRLAPTRVYQRGAGAQHHLPAHALHRSLPPGVTRS